MRLYLSSARLGNHPGRLVALARGGRRALVVVNAVDHLAPEKREKRLDAEAAALRELGLDPEELDLRAYAGGADADALEARLRAADLLWVRGGNSFVLVRAARRSGLDRVLPRLLAEDALAYGGYSAAITLLGPHLRGVELVDDPGALPGGASEPGDWLGLGILPYAVAPHYRSDHPESEATGRLVEHYVDHHVPFVALRDGEVIVQDGSGGAAVLRLDGRESPLPPAAFHQGRRAGA